MSLVNVPFEDRGMRRDQNDAVAGILSVRDASQPAEEAADREAECSSQEFRELERAADMEDERSSPTSPTSPRSASPLEELTYEAEPVHNTMREIWGRNLRHRV